MRNKDRIVVYIVGFVLGTLLVSIIMTRRAAQEESAEDPWLAQNRAVIEAGAEPLPAAVPDVIKAGRILDFGYLPGDGEPEEKIWLLNFDESYPYVRVVEETKGGTLVYMAADQILVELADGVDVTELKPMLDELGLRLRMFNRKDRIVVLGVLSTRIDAVPATIKALEPWSSFFRSVGPDMIRFQEK